MTRSTVKNAMALMLIAVVLLFSGCDLLGDLLGLHDDLNDNQVLLEKLFGALAKADQEIQAYAAANAGAFKTGFNMSVSGFVRTRTYTNYTNANGVVVTGTDVMTYDRNPDTMGAALLSGDMDMTFTFPSESPYLLTLNMNGTTIPPTYTQCTVNGDDFLTDYIDMHDDMGPPGP